VNATAILAAAGSGERLGAGVPKAFVELAGRPMLEWSLAALAEAGSIGEVLVTVPATGTVPSVPGATPVEGGPSRSESVANAIDRVETDLVLVHDAARPLATAALFDAIVAELEADRDADAVIAATPVTDTTKEVLPGSREVRRTLDRSSLWSIQTPQGFRTDALRSALASTELLSQASDDAMLVERNGGRVLVHEAPAENFKVTTPLDLEVAERLLRGREDA
jgi:2-C-methyl-D-erythritol 4-phosphate cytidylyltransferase